MKKKDILELLEGGDRRSIGLADEVVRIVSNDLRLFPKLIAGLWSDDQLVRMRVADATEKVTREHPELLRPYKKELLGQLAQAQEPELRWHLAAMAPRLPLTKRERELVMKSLQLYLKDRHSIVKTFALQALADVAADDQDLRGQVFAVLQHAERSGTSAMKSRSRKLLAKFEGAGGRTPQQVSRSDSGAP